LQAEHHAVWHAPSAKLIDISFKPDGEKRILFLPDNRNIFDGTAIIMPIHKSLRKDPRIEYIIKQAETHASLRGDAFKKGEAPIPTGEAIGRGWAPNV
jgi:hypothetical protein